MSNCSIVDNIFSLLIAMSLVVSEIDSVSSFRAFRFFLFSPFQDLPSLTGSLFEIDRFK